ncbi:hypothetical protein CBR_g24290 [Chara braunii]|uniref:Uncharacterized protein n=1 Tax=Chara braunii TaxID=69332 RepID=A0A388JM98_CHABU|nr:hypothetical protein CBR_g24290 [Chara braunii]|eukprot:GBG58939.1 hypothetical protein CBR_g24290 [Chara braunii]
MSGSAFKWVKPDVYPLLAALGVGLTFLAYQSARALTKNPDVTWDKEKRRTAEIDEREGKEYRQGAFRKFVKSKYDYEDVRTPLQKAQK